MATNPLRHDHQPAYVLHSYPFRETSLVVETFTRDHGRVALVARGARRPRSVLRGVLMAFQPLLVSWTGRSELHTLVAAEREGGYAPLKGDALICGFYLNELLLRLLLRDDPHEQLYTAYRDALAELVSADDQGAVLRRFELSLLGELGYAVLLDREADSGAPIAAEQRYVYVIERGPVPAAGRAAGNGVELTGQTLLDMQCGNFASNATQREIGAPSKQDQDHREPRQQETTPEGRLALVGLEIRARHAQGPRQLARVSGPHCLRRGWRLWRFVGRRTVP
jgi:DNA repair protein RecO (recombination protein O)